MIPLGMTTSTGAQSQHAAAIRGTAAAW
jgi:hypothetical protein